MTGVVCTFLGLTFYEGSRKPSPVLHRPLSCIAKLFVGNGLVPFRCMHFRHLYEFRFVEQTEGMVGTKASP
jgi:hypothetical protein